MRIFFVVLSMMFAITAMAADMQATGRDTPQRGMCRDEVKKVCGDIKPGDGKIKQCVEANRDKFSPTCRERMEHAHERAEAAHKACKADIKNLCAGVEPGSGRLHQCLKKNESSVSAECRDAMQHKTHQPRPAKDAT